MMNVQKMIARVEKLKIEVAAMQKVAHAERKRTVKIVTKNDKARKELEDKLRALPTEQCGGNGAPLSAKAQRLVAGIDAFRARDDAFDLGRDGDYLEDSAIGALSAMRDALNALVDGKGKKRDGHLVNYERSLAGLNK